MMLRAIFTLMTFFSASLFGSTIAMPAPMIRRLPPATATASAKYTIISLGTLPNYQTSQASAINDSRLVVGVVCCSTVSGTLNSQAVEFQYPSGPLTPIGPSTGNELGDTYATAINSLGFIVGYAVYFNFYGGACSSYTNAIAFAGPGFAVPPYGCERAFPSAISNNGVVVGNAFETFYNQGAFVSNQGTAAVLGPGTVWGVNDLGTAVGQDTSNIATLYTVATPGVSTEIGTLGGPTSSAEAIADTGVVVGWATVTSGLGHAFEYYHGYMYDFGTPIGTNPIKTSSGADSVNNFNEFVGSYLRPGRNQNPRPFVYANNAMRDLTNLIQNGAGWTLLSAASINDCGDIVGTASYNGQQVGYLAKPINENNQTKREKFGCTF